MTGAGGGTSQWKYKTGGEGDRGVGRMHGAGEILGSAKKKKEVDRTREESEASGTKAVHFSHLILFIAHSKVALCVRGDRCGVFV